MKSNSNPIWNSPTHSNVSYTVIKIHYDKDISIKNYPVACEKYIDNTSQRSVLAATFHCHFVTTQLLGSGGGAIWDRDTKVHDGVGRRRTGLSAFTDTLLWFKRFQWKMQNKRRAGITVYYTLSLKKVRNKRIYSFGEFEFQKKWNLQFNEHILRHNHAC